jgi:flagellar motor switch protein FliN/FliY
VEVLVSNRVVARGEVVIVGGNYGIRIIDVVSPSERMAWVEA